MISVSFEKEADDSIRKIIVEGHAAYDEEGQDIVCAGISILTITVMNALEEVAGVKLSEREVRPGYSGFVIPKVTDMVQSIQMDTILKTYELGVRSTQAAYPDYITVKDIDVNGGKSDD